jgi:hypothetical protein
LKSDEIDKKYSPNTKQLRRQSVTEQNISLEYFNIAPKAENKYLSSQKHA